MGNSELGELLILFLLILNCSRMFFLKYGKVDSLTILAPICVILSVLQILAWNANFFSIILLIISVFAFFVNFRALLRFLSRLYVDHYSAAFKTGAMIVLILSVCEVAAIIYFFPANFNLSRRNVKKETIRLSGSFSGGFEKSGFFAISDGTVFKYELKNQTSGKENQTAKTENLVSETENQIPKTESSVSETENQTSGKENPAKNPIIIIPDKRADSESYEPLAILLAEKGFTVYSADFYSNDLRWFHNAADSKYLRRMFMRFDYRKNPVQFNAKKEFFSYNSGKEIEAIVKFAENENPGEKVFVISDWMSENALEDFAKQNKERVSGTMKLSEQAEYKTKGFGFVHFTEPFIEYIFAPQKNLSENLPQSNETENASELVPESDRTSETDKTSKSERIKEFENINKLAGRIENCLENKTEEEI